MFVVGWLCVCVCVCLSKVYCVHIHTHYLFTGTHPHTCIHIHTFFVVMANDGILYDISEAEADVVLLAVGRWGFNLDATLLALKALFPLVVRPNLVTAHPPDQPLALANGERLQQTLVYLHVLTKYIT